MIIYVGCLNENRHDKTLKRIPVKKKIPDIVFIFTVVLDCLNESETSPIPEKKQNINEPIVYISLVSVGA